MEYTDYKVKIRLAEDLLGTIPKNKEIYAQFVASKVAEAQGLEEVETVQEICQKGWTGFHADEEGPFLYDYAVKGFLCEAARTLKQFGLLKQLQDKFKRYVFVLPRRVRLPEIDVEPLERPLRAMTALGPRVTLARSDVVKAGAELTFTLRVLEVSGITQNCVKEVLSYGALMGLGQWRSGGFGRFEIVEMEEI